MTLQLTLPPEVEARLRQEAERRGQATEAVALRLLDQHLPPLDDRRAAVGLLQGWMEEDAALSPEEADANAEVLRALDADRPSYRKLFTDLSKAPPK
jgi:hypothetical protein